MNALTRNALSTYAKVGVDANIANATPYRLILLLFDGAIKAVANAKFHMQNKAIAQKGEAISKAIAIIDEGLNLSLDVKVGGELAENLSALYSYMCHRLLVANINNDPSILDEVSRLLGELRGAWAAIEKAPEVIAFDGGAVAAATPAAEKATMSNSFGRV
ncbi:MAG: flagellar export chaperone FliS [Sulfuricella sp.]|nr:flagellar export chaperone FliS [Sulfuricella sp.]